MKLINDKTTLVIKIILLISGNLVSSEHGSNYNVKITGMTCFRLDYILLIDIL